MILRIFLLACTAFIAPSLASFMSLDEFSRKFEDMCFQNEESDPFRINGQDTPLSNTMENFIAMAEKLEAANRDPAFDLKAELNYFLKNYLLENIRLTTTGISQWKIEGAILTEIDKMLDYDPNIGYVSPRDEVLTDAEKCSLYFMISHSIVEKRKAVEQFRGAEYNNTVRRTDLDPDAFYPQEIGAVAIRSTNMAVSLSKVLIGMYIGLNDNRKRDVTEFELRGGTQDQLPPDTLIDTLYTLTIADVLMMANWIHSTRQGFAPNGDWVSIPLGLEQKKIDGFCPMVYKQTDAKSAYSYSSVRGAADGLILGKVIKSIYEKKRSARLSEILRMYYSRDGIAVEKDIEMPNIPVSFCSRREVLSSLERNLQNQMTLYGLLTSEKTKDVPTIVGKALDSYQAERTRIFNSMDEKLRDYCSAPPTLDKPEDLPRQTFLDVFVVLDSRTNEELFIQQQLIAGYLAKNMDLRYSGSRMTILVDHRISSGTSGSGRVQLKIVVNDTHSSSCAACAVGQIAYQKSELEREQVIVAIDQLLDERKENETKFNGANGKVVIYFDFESKENQPRDNNKIQGRLEKALRDLHLRHLDTLMYAVGLDKENLKKFARGDPSLIFLASEAAEETVAEKLFLKISSAPGLLQYSDCEDGKNEAGAIYENFVSPMKIQHWVMPPMYFYKSTNLKVMFESTNSVIRVCHNRATMKPENEAKNCMNTSNINRIEFKLSNPCQGFSKETCSPFYFSVIGISNSKDTSTANGNGRIGDYCADMTDQWCGTLDSIKFKVSHDGVRCSGCLGLAAIPTVLLSTLLLAYFLHKNL